MIDSLKFKDTKGNWFRLRIYKDCYVYNQYDVSDNFPDDKDLQKKMVDEIAKGKASFYKLLLDKGNINRFEFETIDVSQSIFTEYNQQGNKSLNTTLKDMLKKNNIEKSIIDDTEIVIKETGLLFLGQKSALLNN